MAVLELLTATGSALRRTFGDRDGDRGGFVPRLGALQLYADLYDDADNEPGDTRYAAFRRTARLPARYRTVYNPTARCVDFYPAHVYPGDWNIDGRPSPDGRPNRLWFAADAFDERPGVPSGTLPAAIMQALDWGNGAAALLVYVRTLAKLGTVLVEAIDRPADPETGTVGKVWPEVVDPRDVVDLELSAAGHVRRYAIQYRAVNPRTKQVGTFRKDVDRMGVVSRWDRDIVEEVEHGYGFCPAVWVKGFDAGGYYGVPAVAKAVRKILEYNRIAAPTSDWVAKFLDQPLVFWTDADFKKNPDIVFSVPAGGETDGPSQTTNYMKLPAGGSVGPLIGQLPVAEVGGYLDRLAREVEKDLPEIVVSEQLRAMSQVTAPGAERVMADAAGRLDEVQGNADAGLVKLTQMLVAIAGHRLNGGAWGPSSRLTRQQRKFAAFGLESYAAGDLDFSLIRRPLVAETEDERIARAAARERLASPTALREVGYSNEDIYGPTGVPTERPGILAERQEAQLGAADLFGRAIAGGQV